MPVTQFTPFASLAGGALIGVSAVLLLAVSGRTAGISGIIGRLLAPEPKSRPFEAAAFLIGLVAAPLAWSAVTHVAVEQTVSGNLPALAVAGLLVGIGAGLANGCTSGHGVCGLSRFSVRSLAATLTFMLTGVLAVFAVRHVTGG